MRSTPRAIVDSSLQQLYDGHLPIHAQLQVSLGVNRDLSGEPHWATYLLDQPIEIAGEIHTEITVKHFCFDRTLAPIGKSVITLMLTTPYAYWQRIYGRSLYHEAKIQESNRLIEQLERIYPGITADIEVVDVATPLTYERSTGNWQGSVCGWLLTKQTLPLTIKGIPKTIAGLRGLYTIGQWVEPGGGVPIVAMSGRSIVQQICHEDRQIFRTTIASHRSPIELVRYAPQQHTLRSIAQTLRGSNVIMPIEPKEDPASWEILHDVTMC